MPIYEYVCEKCETEKEIITTKIQDNVETCSCGSNMKRIMSMNSFRLKGMCWYKDGYCGKSEAKGR